MPWPKSNAYEFFKTHRLCPDCGKRLMAHQRIQFTPTYRVDHMLGVPCYCMACSGKFRAQARPWMGQIPIVVALAVLALAVLGILAYRSGFVGLGLLVFGSAIAGLLSYDGLCSRWWWRSAKIERVFTYEEGP